MKKIFSQTIASLFLSCFAMKSNAQWQLTGNANATATSGLGTTNAIPLNLVTNNLQRMTITSAGRVGIGTTTPPNIFTVKGAGSTPAASWVSAGAPLFVGYGETAVGNADYILSMASTSNNGRPVFVGRRSRGTLALPTTMANNDFIMSMLASAYDGSVFQNPATIDFLVDGTPSAGNVPARISFVTGSNSTNRAERLKILSSGDVSIATGNLSVAKYATVKGLFSANGNVDSAYVIAANADSIHGGIVVKDPVSKSVLYSKKSGSNAGIYVEKTSPATNTGCIVARASGSGTGVDAYSTTGEALYAYSDSGLAISGYSAGYNGIYGETGDTLGYYAGYFNGDIYSSGTYYGSDARLKNNIKDFGNGMEIIGSLKPKNYDYKKEGNYALLHLPRGTHYGLIAQDVEKVLPNLVKNSKINLNSRKKKDPTKDEGSNKGEQIDYKAVNYTELIPIIIKGMQEQQAVIEDLHNKVAELTALVEKLTPGSKTAVSNVNLSSATLEQNIPNPPVNNATRINYNIPVNAAKAEMVITDVYGKRVKQINLNNSGKGSLNVDTNGLAAGTYSYTLLVDGKMVETKKMVVN